MPRPVPLLLHVMAFVVVMTVMPPSAAQLTDEVAFTEGRYVRIAFGDIPRTTQVEASGQWNMVEYARSAGSLPGPSFQLPSGMLLDGASCTCGNVTLAAQPNGMYDVVYAQPPTGPHVVAVRYHREGNSAFAFSFGQAESPAWSVNLYVVPGQTVASNLQPRTAGMPSTSENPGYEIWQFTDDGSHPSWFVVNAGTLATATTEKSPLPSLYVALAFVAGCLIWAILVAKGLVQKRSRKQIAAVAAHVEAAGQDPPAVLEAKKRFLMGTLKDIELAKQNGDLEAPIYDAVKADFKRQAVTVMRAIEESGPTP